MASGGKKGGEKALPSRGGSKSSKNRVVKETAANTTNDGKKGRRRSLSSAGIYSSPLASPIPQRPASPAGSSSSEQDVAEDHVLVSSVTRSVNSHNERNDGHQGSSTVHQSRLQRHHHLHENEQREEEEGGFSGRRMRPVGMEAERRSRSSSSASSTSTSSSDTSDEEGLCSGASSSSSVSTPRDAAEDRFPMSAGKTAVGGHQQPSSWTSVGRKDKALNGVEERRKSSKGTGHADESSKTSGGQLYRPTLLSSGEDQSGARVSNASTVSGVKGEVGASGKHRGLVNGVEGNNVSSDVASENVSNSPALLLAEIICDVADFTHSLALKVSSRTGLSWTPKALQQPEETGTKKRGPQKRVPKDPNEPRRPLSSYNLWCEHVRKRLKQEEPERALRLAELADMWKALPQFEKTTWEQVAKEKKDSYNQLMEAYKANAGTMSATGGVVPVPPVASVARRNP